MANSKLNFPTIVLDPNPNNIIKTVQMLNLPTESGYNARIYMLDESQGGIALEIEKNSNGYFLSILDSYSNNTWAVRAYTQLTQL